jgi:hypothetical protein
MELSKDEYVAQALTKLVCDFMDEYGCEPDMDNGGYNEGMLDQWLRYMRIAKEIADLNR